MGMYTQAKGMLNIRGIGSDEEYADVTHTLETVKQNFKHERLVDRGWICEGTFVHQCSNGSIFIFFGAELKNYSNEIEVWIAYLLKHFPSAEGKFDVQYEQYNFPTTYYIYKGKIVDKKQCHVEQNGYGNDIQ